MLENTEHNVNDILFIISKFNWITLLARTEPILMQEKYLIRFVQALLYLGGFRTESCKKVHSIN